MRAYAADRFGDLDQLRLRELPRPAPRPGELLVRVKAAAVNPADLKVLAHEDGGRFLHASVFPLILGFDFSGVIAEVGAGVTGRHVGDEVYGFLPYSSRTRGGTFAEYVATKADGVGKKPRTISHEQAAAAATVACTALQGLRDQGRLAAGGRVLINGASGGVGSFAVQIGKLLGARVVATASAAKLEHVRALGADRVVDYRTTRVRDLGETFTTIFDAASTSSYGECVPLLERGGTYVDTLPGLGTVAGMARGLVSSKRCVFLIVKSLTRDLDQLATWFDEGKLASSVERVYPLAELPAALAHQRTGNVRGKLAIRID